MLSANELKDQMRNAPASDAFAQSHQEYYQELMNMHPDNIRVLPRSPCLRELKTGQIWPWNESMAQRPDLCECCNEDGTPYDPNVRPAPAPKPQPVYNTDISHKPVGDEHTAPVGMASQVLGVGPQFSQDFTEQTTRKEALEIPTQAEPVDVTNVVNAIFNKAR